MQNILNFFIKISLIAYPAVGLILLLSGGLHSAFAQDSAIDSVSVVLAPRHEALLAAETDAKVLRMFKEFGQSFKKGDNLVQLDTTTANLNVRRAGAVLNEARKTFSILQELYETKSASILELENARSELAVAEVDLAIALQEHSRCMVKAPYPGRVRKVLAHEHEWVEKGDPLMEITDDSVLLAKFLLPSSMFGTVKPGAEVSVVVQETGTVQTGTISHTGAVMDPSSRSFEVYAKVGNADAALRPGMRGTVRLTP